MMHIQAWASILGMAIVASAAFDPERYSYCLPDRGYVVTDGDVAAAALYNELTPATGLVMEPGFCIYRHVNSTIVSLCNGRARNRTVTRDEVQRGVQQLKKDCGADGSYSGFHIVNNLTFANYGTTGPPKSGPGNPPDTPGGRRGSLASAKFRRDGCPSLIDCDTQNIGFDGTTRFCCKEPEGHSLKPDGSCPLASPKNFCQSYCEVKRTGLLGIEQVVDDISYTQPTELSKGTEISVDTGFDIGVSGILKEVFEGSVGFTWSTGVTKTKTITLLPTVEKLTEGHRVKWVYFPRLVETCGSVTTQEWSPPQGGNPGGTPFGDGTCSGEPKTFGNICSLSAALDLEGNPKVDYAERIEDGSGQALPIDQQSDSYKNVCGFKGTDPDGDGETECKAPVPVRK